MNRTEHGYYRPRGVDIRPILSINLYDDFSDTDPAPWWMTPLGTVITSSGALQASAIASNTYNMISNSELTADLTDWTAYLTTVQARVDSSADPGDDSSGHGALDKWAHKITVTGGEGSSYQQRTTIPGASYTATVLTYSPSGNTTVNAAGMQLILTGAATTVENTWQTLTVTALATGVTSNLWLLCTGAVNGDLAYHDAMTMRLNSAIAYGNLYSPNAMITVNMISPAALVTPRAILLRAADTLNFVRLLLLPNTAGNDCILETVTAGVRATVAQADVDWTAGGTDLVRVTAQGVTYTVEYMKSGASAWTTAFTTTSASFIANQLFGVQLFAAADNSFSDFLVQPL